MITLNWENIIFSFLEKENIPYRKYGQNGWININSPFVEDTNFKLGIQLETGIYHDFKSNLSGDFISFLTKFYNVNRSDINSKILELADKNDLKFVDKKNIQINTNIDFPNFKMLDIENILYYNKEPINEEKKIVNYLKNRCLTNKEILSYFAYITDDEFKWKNKFLILFYEKNKIVYGIARDYEGSSKLRYMNLSGNSRNYLFPSFLEKEKTDDTLVITEGIFDALSVYQPSVAIMGNFISDVQIKKLLSNDKIKNIIFLPDNDSSFEVKSIVYSNFLNNAYRILSKNIHMNIFISLLPEDIKDANEYYIKHNKKFDTKKSLLSLKDFKFHIIKSKLKNGLKELSIQ